MSPQKRSALMSRIKGKNTGPEKIIADALHARGLSFRKYAKDLPGRPDIVFRKSKVAVFIDGNFWHGWRFPLWKGKLTGWWKSKIETNRIRDQRNFRKLRRLGWKVIRLWEHQVEQNVTVCLNRIITANDLQLGVKR